MEERFDQILHNQAKMLEHLTVLNKDVNELKVGYKRLEEGQEELIERVTSLEEGQEELIGRVTLLEEGQQELKQKVTSLEEGQQELKEVQIEIKKEQRLIRKGFSWVHEDYFETKEKVEKLREMQEQTA